MKKYLFGLAFALAVSFSAAATNSFGLSAQGWKADTAGSASSSSTGGSMSETSAAGNGFAANATVNATGGQAQAWGSFSPTGVDVGTKQSSYSAGASGSLKYGTAVSETAGGQGTDVNSYAGGSFKNGGFGGWGGWGN